MQYVPCYYQNQVLSLISLWKDEAFKDGFEEEDFDLVFGTTEELSYKIKFIDGDHRSKFHGRGWEKLYVTMICFMVILLNWICKQKISSFTLI